MMQKHLQNSPAVYTIYAPDILNSHINPFVPVAKIKSMEVTNPSPKTWNPRRYSYTGLKKLSKNSRIHHVA
jgi:hypothetical protein